MSIDSWDGVSAARCQRHASSPLCTRQLYRVTVQGGFSHGHLHTILQCEWLTRLRVPCCRFNMATATCEPGSVCRDWQQLVWAGSTSLGCGVVSLPVTCSDAENLLSQCTLVLHYKQLVELTLPFTVVDFSCELHGSYANFLSCYCFFRERAKWLLLPTTRWKYTPAISGLRLISRLVWCPSKVLSVSTNCNFDSPTTLFAAH